MSYGSTVSSISASIFRPTQPAGSAASRARRSVGRRPPEQHRPRVPQSALRLPRRFVESPLHFRAVALLSGGGYTESGDGYANAGANLGGNAFWLLLALGLGYYIVSEAATGTTLGRMVGIRVVGEDGEQLTFVAAVARNLLRLVEGLFFYLVT